MQLEEQPMADRPDPLPPAPSAPDPRTAAEIRRRIATGYYDRPDVIRETAARMLDKRVLPSEE